MITRFDNFNVPDLRAISNEFWKMTTVVNWKKVIIDYHKVKDDDFNGRERNEKYKKIKELSEKRLCLNYEYSQVKEFHKEYLNIYQQLCEFFNPISGDLGVSDDGYWDLLSSVIGSGKRFTKSCIGNNNVLVNMAKNNKYVENFEYILSIDESRYNEIRDKYDPVFKDIRKYNL